MKGSAPQILLNRREATLQLFIIHYSFRKGQTLISLAALDSFPQGGSQDMEEVTSHQSLSGQQRTAAGDPGAGNAVAAAEAAAGKPHAAQARRAPGRRTGPTGHRQSGDRGSAGAGHPLASL